MLNKTIITAIIFATSYISYGQLSGNLETNINQLKQPTKIGVGANLQYLFYYSMTSLPGLNAGVMYEYDKEFSNGRLTFPMRLQYRQYVIGVHGCSGGGYVEGNLGGKIIPKTRDESNAFAPLGSVGIGYRLPMSYDFNFYLGGTFENNTFNKMVGFKLGYTF